jgi:hypothetical protein
MTTTQKCTKDTVRYIRETDKYLSIIDIHETGTIQIWFREYKNNFYKFKTKNNDGLFSLFCRKKIQSNNWLVEGVCVLKNKI